MLLVLADDLTGAADTGVAFTVAGLGTTLRMDGGATHAGSPATPASAGPDVVCVDTGTRSSSAEQAGRAVHRVTRAGMSGRGVYKKIDSTLRGNVGAEVAAALDASGCHVALCAPAFPATGRTTRGGRQLVDGRPLATTGVWRRADGAVPERVAGLFIDSGLPTAEIGLADVRSGREYLAGMLRAAVRSGSRVVVCDAETDADLATLAAAGAGCGDLCTLWVGSGGLAGVLPGALGLTAGSPASAVPDEGAGPTGPLLAVAGSPSEQARAQARQLVAAGFTEVRLPAATLLDGTADDLAVLAATLFRALRHGDTAVTICGGELIGERDAAAYAATALGRTVAQALPSGTGLLLTGGEIARAVLVAAGVRELALAGEVEPGVVLNHAAELGAPVVTKAGAFGDEDTLIRAVSALRGNRHTPADEQYC